MAELSALPSLLLLLLLALSLCLLDFEEPLSSSALDDFSLLRELGLADSDSDSPFVLVRSALLEVVADGFALGLLEVAECEEVDGVDFAEVVALGDALERGVAVALGEAVALGVIVALGVALAPGVAVP